MILRNRVGIYLLFIIIAIPACQETFRLDLSTEEMEYQPTETLVPDKCERPYSEDSIWNIPIDWTVARIHPDSEFMIDAFFESYSWIGANADRYAPNIYFVSNETPLVSVKLREYRFRDAINDSQIVYGEPAGTVLMPLPSHAVPAPGTDGQLAVINLDTGEEWGLNKGKKITEDYWEVGGAYRYHIENSGVPPQGFGQRGAGLGQFAGIVRPCEVARGYIGHAVTLSYDAPCAPEVCAANGWPAVIPPFTKTDGIGREKYDIPEGARLIIDPNKSMDEIFEVCSGVQGCITWVINMQNFGGFIVDKGGHPKTSAEGDATANWDKDIWFDKMLKNIPSNWYKVLDWNYPTSSR